VRSAEADVVTAVRAAHRAAATEKEKSAQSQSRIKLN